MISRMTLNNSISDGLKFIKSNQTREGLWRDFRTLAGQIPDWITGFIIYTIYCFQDLDEHAMKALKTLIKRQRPNGGWSYNSSVPCDCDSTAWAVLSLSLDPTRKPSAIKKVKNTPGVSSPSRIVESLTKTCFGNFDSLKTSRL